jgi:DNA/RNA-binding domain of Phe-tRNA-synthetase-like protein
MRQISFQIDNKIFQQVPNYRRAIVIATRIDNTVSAKSLAAHIAEQSNFVRTTLTTDDTRLVAWRDVFKAVGTKPNEFRPSIDSLVRRILNDKPLGSINPIVDVGTAISLKYVLPAGAHPLLPDTREVVLKCAVDGEFIVKEDGQLKEVPGGEVVLADTGRVATRRWAWRQTELSRIDPSTSALYLNIDALNCIEDATLEAAIEDAKKLLAETFGVEAQSLVLNSSNPSQTITVTD